MAISGCEVLPLLTVCACVRSNFNNTLEIDLQTELLKRNGLLAIDRRHGCTVRTLGYVWAAITLCLDTRYRFAVSALSFEVPVHPTDVFNFALEFVNTLMASREPLRRGMWAASLDLKDAYLHIPIHPGFQRFLAFSYQGRTYKFTSLPFGLSTSPRVFTRVAGAVGSGATKAGDNPICLSRRLADNRGLSSAVQSRSFGDSWSSSGVGLDRSIGRNLSRILHSRWFTSVQGSTCRWERFFPTMERAVSLRAAISSVVLEAGSSALTWSESPRSLGKSGGGGSSLPSAHASASISSSLGLQARGARDHV